MLEDGRMRCVYCGRYFSDERIEKHQVRLRGAAVWGEELLGEIFLWLFACWVIL